MKTEIFGLSGTGKSTYIKRINGVILNNKFEKLIFMVIYFAVHPLHSSRFIFNILYFTRSASIKTWLRLIYLKLCIALPRSLAIDMKSTVVDKFFKKKNVVYEGGLMELALTTFDVVVTEKTFLSYIQNHNILVFELNEDERIARMKQRQRVPRSNILSKEEYLNYFEVTNKNYRIIINLIPSAIYSNEN